MQFFVVVHSRTMHSDDLPRRNATCEWRLESVDTVELMLPYVWTGCRVSVSNLYESKVSGSSIFGSITRPSTLFRPEFGGKYCLGVRKRYRTCSIAVRRFSLTASPTHFDILVMPKIVSESNGRNRSKL